MKLALLLALIGAVIGAFIGSSIGLVGYGGGANGLKVFGGIGFIIGLLSGLSLRK